MSRIKSEAIILSPTYREKTPDVKGKTKLKYDPETGHVQHHHTVEHVSTTPSGHHILRHPNHYYAFNPHTRQIDMHVMGSHWNNGKTFGIHKTAGRKGSTLKAHELYHHLVTHHGLHLESSTEQSRGGMKIWQKLHSMPGVKVTNEDGHRIRKIGEGVTHHRDTDSHYEHGPLHLVAKPHVSSIHSNR